MAEKRKDHKGRILRTGESQRKDGSYQYRFTDPKGKVRYVYAPTLDKLREKETVILRDIADGIDYSAGEITVAELVERYTGIQRGYSKNTKRAYGSAVNHVRNSELGQRKIRTVKLSDAKQWFVDLHDNGMKQNTIGVIQSVIRPAFEMAVEDDILRKNPFKFKLSDVVPNDAYQRCALTDGQKQNYLRFVRERGSRYYDDMVILLGTGLRVSELYGLTKADVDLANRCIHVRRQLCRTAENPYFVTSPKTKSGLRTIPMTGDVYEAFRRVIRNRGIPKIEMIIDGVSGFLFLDKDERPKVAMHLENHMRGLQKHFAEKSGQAVPTITPHVLRHTFCTNAQQAGIDVKSLQYLMGHSNASVTLDVYSHTDYDSVCNAFGKIAASL